MAHRWLLRIVLLVLAWLGVGASCGQPALSIMPGVVNNPQNRSLRRAIFAFATDQLCEEMKARSLPLKLRDPDPTIGRFFPTGCAVQELEGGNFFVQFTGHGYAWTNVTGRIGFEAGAAVEYNQDFLLDGSTMYVYFRQKKTQSTDFQVRMVEGQGKGGAADLATGLLGTSLEETTKRIGARILGSQLARGFTVVRQNDGTASFSLGVLEKGAQPPAPFDKADSSLELLVNDRSELHTGQRDYIGPLAIEDEDDALHLTLHLEGAPAIDALVVAKGVGDPWIMAYETEANPGLPPGPLLFDRPVQASVSIPGAAPVLFKQVLRLPVGSYYLVLDHTAAGGATAPAGQPGDDRAALVSVGVQRGPAD